MKSFKEVNKAIESILNVPQSYDVRMKFQIIKSDLTKEQADDIISNIPEEDRFLYSITSSVPDNYCEDLNLAISAAKRIAEKDDQTFVLSLEKGEFKAAYGSYFDCSEYSGANPAYVTCISILKFMGKL